MTTGTTDAATYYRDPDVVRCVREYCGLAPGSEPGAAFVAGLGADVQGQPAWESAAIVPPEALDTLLARGHDVSRSLWDVGHLMFLLDLDYLNVDLPSEPFLRPAEVFFKLEATYRATRRVLDRLVLDADALMTGRGYHFTGRIPLGDPVVRELAALVPDTPSWWRDVEARRLPGVTAELRPEQARAADGLGLLLEYLGHLVMSEASPHSPIPVVFNGTVVGSGVVGRECASIDFSHAGDPLDTRHARTAFSAYQWHRLRPDLFGPTASSMVPPLSVMPRDERELGEILERGRDFAAGIAAAPYRPAFLPHVARGVRHLLDAYRTSQLAGFHREFLAAARWAPRPDIRRVEELPPCVGAALHRPNDLLLKPEHVQQVVRSLMARDWHPADIAALVRSKYEEDHGWGDRWHRLDPATRAEFDVRVFAGMVRTGLDGLIDCNCVSAQEKGLCPRTGCQYDLRHDRIRLEVLRSR
jgi:hypothetical protein